MADKLICQDCGEEVDRRDAHFFRRAEDGNAVAVFCGLCFRALLRAIGVILS